MKVAIFPGRCGTKQIAEFNHHECSPSQCSSIEDVRREIDRIDASIIANLKERAGYVHKASQFKTDVTSVKASDRVKAMLEKRKQWAKEAGLSPDFMENLFKTIVDYFIGQEMEAWTTNSGGK